ncbi:MAG TPA: 7TM diverse intracellular signaling domain-containing protein [Oligoflexus sp.]|uniref:7TM diverse intracellular signaling domain-containing protein n=1 Tax=Oligoflexus sp. TaxID=1971216 RepID=UPI002D3C209F|nr:7TM diverse intracellular signaling domain-containing protein [Oligoflexus sp.]HYX38168.1 7TM diverse intracellular signaling domain-containing protein [Oligoflexus sp.]
MACRIIVGMFLCLGMLISGREAALAQTGAPTLDLRQSNPDFKRGHMILPDWEIYWQQFLSPEDLQAGKGLLNGVLNQEFFESLEGVIIQGVLQKYGYATFRTRVVLPPSQEPLILSTNKIQAGTKIWIDGRLAGESGTIGMDSDSVKVVYVPLQMELMPRPEGNEIVIQMANYRTAFMGPYRPWTVTERKSYGIKLSTKLILDFLLIGAAIVMCFYHFALYVIRPSEPAARNFAFFCLIMAIRSFVMSEGFLAVWADTFGPMNGIWGSRVELLGFTLGVTFFYSFLANLFPKEIPKFLTVGIVSISLVYTALILIFASGVYQEYLRPYQLIVVLAGFVVLYSLSLAIKRRREGSRIFVFGFIILFGTVINDILYNNRVINTFDMVALGLFSFIFFQSVILSKRFAKAFEQVSIAEKEIRTLNDDLELKVIERTQTIRTILDNVRSGFLMIDSEFRVQEGFTKSCWEILGPQVAPRVPLADLLDVSNRDRSLLELALRQAFEDVMPEDVTLAQIPSRYPLGRKVVALQGSVIRNSLGKPEALLLSISDASQLVKAEQESSKNKSLLKIISEKSSFRAFLKDSLDSLNGCLSLIDQQNQREVAMALHTLKGNFALYGLEPIAAFIHEIEEKKVLSKLDIRAIVQTVEEFISLNGPILGIVSHGLDQDAYEISGESLHKLEIDLHKASINRTAMQVVQGWVREVRMVPVRELLGPIEANVARVADALGKHVHFSMKGADLRVDPDRMRHPLKNLIHAVINSIDHGIEYPEERGDKEAAGHVNLTFGYDEMAYLRVEVTDDGRGLDLDLIRVRALEKGLVTAQQLDAMSEDEVQTLIFRQGFSTKSDVSEFSGRGVGIAALDNAVRSLGGQIRIRSQANAGTTIEISIPTEQTMALLTGIA